MIIPQVFESVPVGNLTPHPDNPRRGDVDRIQSSIEATGFFGACLVQRSTGRIVVGEHRWRAAQNAGEKEVPVLYLDVDDETAKRIMIADNRTNDFATWDDEGLARVLAELAETDRALEGLSFTLPDLESLQAGHTDDATDYEDKEQFENVPPSVLMADPAHTVKQGEVYRLDRHVLVVAQVTVDWPLWVPHLVGDAVFCAHPSPHLPLSSLARARPLVMVTSSAYLAGHVLDKWEGAGYPVEVAS